MFLRSTHNLRKREALECPATETGSCVRSRTIYFLYTQETTQEEQNIETKTYCTVYVIRDDTTKC